MRALRVAILLGVALLGAGCWKVSLENGGLQCASGERCPEGYECIAGACWQKGTGPNSVDLAGVDLTGVVLDFTPTNVDGDGSLSLGAACGNGTECQSGNCVDGVCCNESDATCDGCRACNVAGSVGTCSAVHDGDDPHATCAADPTKCQAGGCNGGGACKPASATVQCLATSCADGQLTTAFCNGTAASCPSAMTAACPGSYACADATSCKTACAATGDCASGFTCTAPSCEPIAGLGDACTGSGQSTCNTGLSCVNDVCCNASACPTCQACNVPGKLGQCANVPNGQPDPQGGCTANLANCVAGGCTNGACAVVAAGTTCNISCSNTTVSYGQYMSVSYKRYVCDGASVGCNMLDGGMTDCNGRICSSSMACTASCSKDADCVADQYCSSGACFQRKTNGTTCTLPSECRSNICSGGTCRQCTYPSSAYCTAAQTQCSTAGACETCSCRNNAGQVTSCANPDGFGTNMVWSDTCGGGFEGSSDWGRCRNNRCECSSSAGEQCQNARAPNCNTTSKTCQCGASGPCPNFQLCMTGNVCLNGPKLPCQQGSECASGVCTAGKCGMMGRGQPCSNYDECSFTMTQAEIDASCGQTCEYGVCTVSCP